VVDVVCEPHRNAASVRIAHRAADDMGEVVGQVQVIDGDVEGVLRRADEVGKEVRDVGGRLAAVGQCADFDRLYSRLAAW
jgi:negative regulator of sigma E activity